MFLSLSFLLINPYTLHQVSLEDDFTYREVRIVWVKDYKAIIGDSLNYAHIILSLVILSCYQNRHRFPYVIAPIQFTHIPSLYLLYHNSRVGN